MTHTEKIIQVRHQVEGAIALVNLLKAELKCLPPEQSERLQDKLWNSTFLAIEDLERVGQS